MSNASAENLLKGLNAPQREAIEHIQGPLLIVAGPGSGKTRVITHRIAYLVRICGVSPHRIAAVTFTNKAAREMKERLERLLGPASRELTASTFHTFCAAVLRREGEAIKLSRDFTIYDDDDQVSIIKRAMKETGVDPKQFAPRAILSAISGAKSQLLDAEGFRLNRRNYFDEIVAKVFERYGKLLAAASALDFDDLLLKTYYLFDKAPDAAAKYQKRFLHLMIDEFQDTNIVQYAIARQLAQVHRNLCVVGDPDQSIYSWRNADIRNILSFQHDYPDAKIIALEENYRSTKTILEAASGLIAQNEQRVEKALWTSNAKGVPIVVAEAYDEQEEAQTVLREVQALAREDHKLGDIAVMYRVNAQSRALEEACLRYGVPYQLVGSLRFYQRQEIKDLIAYMRLVANPDDDASLARVVNVPPRGIGDRTLDELTRLSRELGTSMFQAVGALQAPDGQPGVQLAPRAVQALTNFRDLIIKLQEQADSKNLVELVDLVLERTGYKAHVLDEAEQGEERWENVQELRSTAKDYVEMPSNEGLTAFLERLALVSDTDNLQDRSDAITLITLHQAKGLEFSAVFIVGMEEGILPHSRSMESQEEMEEERRLCYVGVTRAKERLYLLRAFRRGFRGGSEPNLPSRFLADIPKEAIVSSRAGVLRSAALSAGAATASTGRVRPPGFVPTRLASRDADSTDAPHGETDRASQADSSTKAKPVAAFTVGDKVRHAKFGEGVVMASKPTGADVEVTVVFKDGNGVKRLLLSFARLEKVG
ncbi:MAG: AAA family ATPase [SAR202 cluster bacterium]|nr:AAA family ATPase [SAR202 cluster bacterium]